MHRNLLSLNSLATTSILIALFTSALAVNFELDKTFLVRSQSTHDYASDRQSSLELSRSLPQAFLVSVNDSDSLNRDFNIDLSESSLSELETIIQEDWQNLATNEKVFVFSKFRDLNAINQTSSNHHSSDLVLHSDLEHVAKQTFRFTGNRQEINEASQIKVATLWQHDRSLCSYDLFDSSICSTRTSWASTMQTLDRLQQSETMQMIAMESVQSNISRPDTSGIGQVLDQFVAQQEEPRSAAGYVNQIQSLSAQSCSGLRACYGY